jgi:hypothetical protein
MDPRMIELYNLRVLNNYLSLTIGLLAAARQRAMGGGQSTMRASTSRSPQSYEMMYPFSAPPIPPTSTGQLVARPWWATDGRRYDGAMRPV